MVSIESWKERLEKNLTFSTKNVAISWAHFVIKFFCNLCRQYLKSIGTMKHFSEWTLHSLSCTNRFTDKCNLYNWINKHKRLGGALVKCACSYLQGPGFESEVRPIEHLFSCMLSFSNATPIYVCRYLGRTYIKQKNKTILKKRMFSFFYCIHVIGSVGAVTGGSTYVRWGRTTCSNTSEIIYEG